ncbi:MAG: phosphatidylserine/phosphatidylglycerophosphate/cardiolipin synthase family protein [Gammaproteobacteria bacterium]|nr:phosphatidylserine/phosphatidylglycerophosphate/cardiolipin synthase family protein [Gammaproteobacteria bacterium]
MKKTGHVYPLRDKNQFRLLVDASVFYPAMLHAIAGAKNLVLLEMYLFESGRNAESFIQALIDARIRGAQVRVLLDDFGSRELNAWDRRRLTENGIELQFYNPVRLGRWMKNLARDHRKLLLVDNRIAFVGGAGITDEFLPEQGSEHAWRETMVSAHGPVVADWCHLFHQLWPTEACTQELPVAAGSMQGRVTSSFGFFASDIRRSVIGHIRSAEQRVWLCTAYFVPSRKLRRALRRAADRGVDVRLLLPGVRTDHPGVRRAGQRYYGRLLRHGVRIFEYQPRVLHAKTVVCDQWVSIGSSNLDRWNMRWNLEANQNIEDSGFAREAVAMMETDFSNSVECTWENWLGRPWRDRLSIYLWSRIGLWLTSWERRNGK